MSNDACAGRRRVVGECEPELVDEVGQDRQGIRAACNEREGLDHDLTSE